MYPKVPDYFPITLVFDIGHRGMHKLKMLSLNAHNFSFLFAVLQFLGIWTITESPASTLEPCLAEMFTLCKLSGIRDYIRD